MADIIKPLMPATVRQIPAPAPVVLPAGAGETVRNFNMQSSAPPELSGRPAEAQIPEPTGNQDNA